MTEFVNIKNFFQYLIGALAGTIFIVFIVLLALLVVPLALFSQAIDWFWLNEE